MEKITTKTIEQENPHFVLEMIAEGVAEEAVKHSMETRFKQWGDLDKTGRTKLDAEYLSEVKLLKTYLCERAETHYQYNEDFNKKVKSKSNKGRDYLYTFMYHWTGNYGGKFAHKDSYKRSMTNWYRDRDEFNKREAAKS